jgi:hypothetical protein
MLPEISRRCLACGAAVRRGARFCHQCGADSEQPTVAEQETQTGATSGAADAGTNAAASVADEAPLELPEPPDTGTLAETWEQWDESLHARDADEGGTAVASTPAELSAPVESSTPIDLPAPVEAPPSARPATEVEKTAHPASPAPVEGEDARVESEADERADSNSAGRRRPSTIVRENLRPRVEKMREASIVVMEDASEDPGLRFILIAVALFVLFLLFLLVSSFLR